METLIHVMHVVAIKDAHAWSGMSPAQLSMIGFWNLIFVWLKVSPKPKSRDLQQALISSRRAVIATMALLPPMGTHRRARPTREHDPLHGK